MPVSTYKGVAKTAPSCLPGTTGGGGAWLHSLPRQGMQRPGVPDSYALVERYESALTFVG